MQDFPLAAGYSRVSALVVLVAVVAADVLQSAVVRDIDLIDEADAQA